MGRKTDFATGKTNAQAKNLCIKIQRYQGMCFSISYYFLFSFFAVSSGSDKWFSHRKNEFDNNQIKFNPLAKFIA